MSDLTYIDNSGTGEEFGKAYHYSQCVRLGDIVKCAGQGGWDAEGKIDANDAASQVDLAFQNVDKVLQAAGLRGWEDVYSVRSFHTDLKTSLPLFVEKMKQRIPDHRPIWTCTGANGLALPEMLLEVEVEAWARKS